jgi:hypothetical protein
VSPLSDAPTSEATRAANRSGELAGIDAAMRSVIHRNIKSLRREHQREEGAQTKAMRQYRLRCQNGLDISCPITGSSHGQDRLGMRVNQDDERMSVPR